MTDHELRLAAPPESADGDPFVRTIMTHRLLGVAPPAPVALALRLMAEHAVRHLPVMDGGGHCIGLVVETDLLRGLIWPGLTVADVCRTVPTVGPADRRSVAAQVMSAAGADAVLVVEQDRLVGLVTATDLIRSVAADAAAS